MGALVVLWVGGCGANAQVGLPSADAGTTSTTGALGVLGNGWSVRFVDANGMAPIYSATLATAGRVMTFTMVDAREGRPRPGSPTCTVTTDRVVFSITVADDGAALTGTLATVSRYDGTDCPPFVTAGVEQRATQPFSGRRRTTMTSVFGDAGGDWDILDSDGRVAVTVTLQGSSFNGLIGARLAFQGVFSGGTLAGNGDSVLFNGMRP